jgi:hypothetical protein
MLNPRNAKIKMMSSQVVRFILVKLSKKPEESPESPIVRLGGDTSLDCNIELDKLFELSIIIKIYILILIIIAHLI